MRRLTDDLVLSVKDQIRQIRYAIRNEADAGERPTVDRKPAFVPVDQALELIGSPVARLADGFLTQVEHVTLSLMAADRDARQDIVFPCPIGDYFAKGVGARPFTATHYYAVKDLLRRYGATNVLVFEHAIEQAHTNLLARHGDLLWAAPASDPKERAAALARACAAAAVHLAAARPIQKLAFGVAAANAPKHIMLSPNVYCFLVLGLASAIASIKPDHAALAEDVIESADAVVDARFARLCALLGGKDPAGALGKEFLALVPFLP